MPTNLLYTLIKQIGRQLATTFVMLLPSVAESPYSASHESFS